MNISSLHRISDYAIQITNRQVDDPRPQGLLKHNFNKDQGSAYYAFLYCLVVKTRPKLMIDLGSGFGMSALHLAYGYPGGQVVSIDTVNKDRPTLPNIIYYNGDSCDFAYQLICTRTTNIDLLFIDTEHTYQQIMKEWNLYCSLISRNGIVLFDDININNEMKMAWAEIPEPKVELPLHNHCGFGAYLLK